MSSDPLPVFRDWLGQILISKTRNDFQLNSGQQNRVQPVILNTAAFIEPGDASLSETLNPFRHVPEGAVASTLLHVPLQGQRG